MKGWLLIKNNIFFCVFLVAHILMVGLAINGQTHIKDININKAIFYHFIMTFLFGLGYLLSINLIKDKKHTTAVQYLTLDKTFFYLAFALTTFGLFTSILTVNTIYPIKQYILHLFDYGQHKELLVDIKYKSNTSGLSGIVKMFNYAPLAVFFIVSSYLNFYKIQKKSDEKKLIGLLVYTIICSLTKTFFSLDRLTLLGVLVVMLYTLFFSKTKLKNYFIAVILLIFLILSFITSAKMSNLGIVEFLRLYCRLGLTNFELLIENPVNYTWGLNTFFMPLYFIAKFFNIHLDVPQAKVVIWDNAQYFFGYLFLDFKFFSFIVVFLLGIMIARFQMLINRKKKYAISMFFVILFAISTLVVVPIIRGVEFWLMLIIALGSLWLIKVDNQ